MIDALGQYYEIGDFVAVGIGAGVISVGLVIEENNNTTCKIKISSATRSYRYGAGVNGYVEKAVLRGMTVNQGSVIRVAKDHISKIEINRPWWVTRNSPFKEEAEQINLKNIMGLARDIAKRKYEQSQKASPATVS